MFSRVSELFIYTVKRKDVENPKLTHLPQVGSWSRINPWLPWMMMGGAPGGVNYFNTFGTMASLDDLPKDLVEAARAVSPSSCPPRRRIMARPSPASRITPAIIRRRRFLQAGLRRNRRRHPRRSISQRRSRRWK